MDAEKLTTITVAAKEIGVTRPTIYRYIATGELDSVRALGKNLVVVNEKYQALQQTKERKQRKTNGYIASIEARVTKIEKLLDVT